MVEWGGVLAECLVGNSDAEEGPDLPEALAAQAVVGHGLGDDGPVLGSVAAEAEAEVGQFVGNDVVEGGRGHNRPPVEPERPIGRAARPATALIPDEDLLRMDTEMARDSFDPWRELRRCSLAAPRLEGGSHLLQTRFALE